MISFLGRLFCEVAGVDAVCFHVVQLCSGALLVEDVCMAVLQHFMVAIVHISCWLLHLWCEFDSSIESHSAGRFWQSSETNPAELGS